MTEEALKFIRENLAYIAGSGLGIGFLFGAVPALAGYAVEKALSLVNTS